MSNAATYGSMSGNRGDASASGGCQDSNCSPQEYSTIDAYLRQPETHEQTALGYGYFEPKEAVKRRTEKAEKQISESGKKLPK